MHATCIGGRLEQGAAGESGQIGEEQHGEQRYGVWYLCGLYRLFLCRALTRYHLAALAAFYLGLFSYSAAYAHELFQRADSVLSGTHFPSYSNHLQEMPICPPESRLLYPGR